ncbi:retrovirus-related pol polyprotein from transposon TNT 1-94 [Tanacetum coccineum]
MNKLVKGNLVRGLPSKLFENDQTCVACQKGKQHRASCKSKTVSSISQPLHMLHMDLFGPTFVKSLMKKMYCLVVTDDYSRCDNGTEFKNKEMNQFCERKGIKREFSVARTPQQNGAEVVNTACYVQNRVLVTKPHNKTPYELFLGRKPALGFMRPFGCLVIILNTIDHLGKFDGKADEGFFVGYSINSKAFRVFNSRTRIVEENMHVQFSTKACDDAGKARMKTEIMKRSTNIVNAASTNKFNAVGAKTSIELLDDPNMPELEDIVYSDDDEDLGAEADMNNLDAFMPDQAGIDGYAGRASAIQVKLQKVWTLVDLPNGKRPIGTKWVYRNKKDERGIVINNKERLVAQEYTQEERIDYDEVFAAVARIEAIRLFLAYASFKDFMVYQMDVKSAFLYGKIEEEIYVCQPPGFEDPDFPDRVYKVEKALYGLHQAHRAWYETLSTYLLDNGFQRGKIDKTLFIIRDKGMQVKQKEDGIFISQEKYVTKILKKFGFIDVKTASIPMETQNPLLKDEDGSHNRKLESNFLGVIDFMAEQEAD